MRLDEEIDAYIRKKRYRQINRVLLYQNGSILADLYYNGFDRNSKNVIKSVAKSIMSMGTGIALDKGLLKSLDEPICQWIPQFNEGRDMSHRSITVRHLLTMTSGIFWNGGVHYHCPMMAQMRRSGDWISHIADCAVTDIPGTKYHYKEWDVILLARVLDGVCGDMFAFLEEFLYEPMGIDSERWYRSPCGVYYSVADGDEGMEENRSNLHAYDMLKIGQLFLQGGVYEGRRILSEEYIRQAVEPLACNAGYGMLWWVDAEGNWYECRGYGGQHITVFPKKEAVIVTQATPTARGMGYDDLVVFCRELL